MLQILFLVLGLLVESAHSVALTSHQQDLLCEILLVPQNSELRDLPLNPQAVTSILNNVRTFKRMQTFRPVKRLGDPQVQEYVGHVLAILSRSSDPSLRTLAEDLSLLHLKPKGSLEIWDRENLTERFTQEIEREASSELLKLPPAFLRFMNQHGHRLLVVAGAITRCTQLRNIRGVTPRGWDKPWDDIPGAGGPGGAVVNIFKLNCDHGSSNLILHEMLHGLDLSWAYETGQFLSDRPAFLNLWSETEFQDEDYYMRDYSEETFAEFGALYFTGGRDREFLRDVYPAWFEYFRNLEGRLNLP